MGSLPSLADLAITDRHLAAWALKVAAVPRAIFDSYLLSADTVTRARLFTYTAETLAPASGLVSQRVAPARSGFG